jgi:hypothetical protein
MMKSILMSSHFQVGVFNGCSKPIGLRWFVLTLSTSIIFYHIASSLVLHSCLPNGMVKSTYVPNRIGIPIHGGDLGHHMLHMKEKAQESPMRSLQPKRGGEKKERRKKEKEESVTSYAHQSRWSNRCD